MYYVSLSLSLSLSLCVSLSLSLPPSLSNPFPLSACLLALPVCFSVPACLPARLFAWLPSGQSLNRSACVCVWLSVCRSVLPLCLPLSLCQSLPGSSSLVRVSHFLFCLYGVMLRFYWYQAAAVAQSMVAVCRIRIREAMTMNCSDQGLFCWHPPSRDFWRGIRFCSSLIVY